LKTVEKGGVDNLDLQRQADISMLEAKTAMKHGQRIAANRKKNNQRLNMKTEKLFRLREYLRI
jgi:hypothetical protein